MGKKMIYRWSVEWENETRVRISTPNDEATAISIELNEIISPRFPNRLAQSLPKGFNYNHALRWFFDHIDGVESKQTKFGFLVMNKRRLNVTLAQYAAAFYITGVKPYGFRSRDVYVKTEKEWRAINDFIMTAFVMPQRIDHSDIRYVVGGNPIGDYSAPVSIAMLVADVTKEPLFTPISSCADYTEYVVISARWYSVLSQIYGMARADREGSAWQFAKQNMFRMFDPSIPRDCPNRIHFPIALDLSDEYRAWLNDPENCAGWSVDGDNLLFKDEQSMVMFRILNEI